MGKIDLPSPEVEVAVWGQDVGGGSGVQFGMYFEVPVRHSSGVVKQAGGAGGPFTWEILFPASGDGGRAGGLAGYGVLLALIVS